MVDHAQRNERALVLALVASLLLWNLPFGGLVLFPFKLLATWLHEMSHGVTMLATGAGFSHLEIYRDTSGIAFAERGVGGAGRAVIASAGYMGAALLGGAMLVLGQSGRRARGILVGFAVALALSLVFWVRNDFGMSAVAIGALMCAAMARFAPEGAALLLVNFVAAQACINAVLDIRVLFRPTLVINGEVVRVSDAHNMAAASFGSHWLWAGVWLVFSFVCLFAALRITHLRGRRRGPDGDREPDREPDRQHPGGGAEPGPA
ncbi:MAG TPA: M50 family metallopeptidase [Kofleriaceae bacterium]|nr:M50 family metallopeptidase [Kofleriaceae bacterium]